MQDKDIILRKTISKIVQDLREQQDKNYLAFCDENSIATSTYDNIINATNNTSFYNLSKVIKGLGLNFSQFGEILDSNLPKEFWEEE